MIDLGTLGGSFSNAADINNSGKIVGQAATAAGRARAFLWQDKNGNGQSDAGEMVDLNTLITPDSGWELTRANGINNKGQIAGVGRVNNGPERAFLLTPKRRRPVMIVPGIAGTYAADTANDDAWIMNRGSDPADLQIDPLAKVYHDLIKTFENVGYTRDKDLFVVNYDWRLTPGPDDGSIDGVVGGITAQSVSDQNFQYGVDYLGVALRRAYERWEQDHPGEKLEEVDVVAHSTGGLVARTYIQSAAYGEAFDTFGAKKLPKVKNLIMVGVPNRGASKAWNPLHDDWNVDVVYVAVLSKIINRAYQKVLAGQTITGPPAPINLDSIKDPWGDPDPVKFINLYVPTIRSLLATYDFIDYGSGYTNVNSNQAQRNTWVLDLNNGLDLTAPIDPSPFADRCKATVIYAASEATPTAVKQRRGSAGESVLSPFSDFVGRDALQGEVWYEDITALVSGDGTVPIDSAAGQFVGDSRVTLKPFTKGNNTNEEVTHTGLMFNRDVQKLILQTVGAPFAEDDISSDEHPFFSATLNVPGAVLPSLIFILDPVDGFVVDGAGRRLGYSQAIGPLAEIPGSIWFGNQNGIGWVFGPVQEPLTLQLTGRGEPYYVMVGVTTDHGDGGLVDSGVLAQGEPRSLPIPIGAGSPNAPPVVNVPAPITATATSSAGASVAFSATATDDEDGGLPVSCDPPPGAVFPLGTTTVQCSATDGGGATGTGSFTVTVDYSWSGVLQPVNADGSSIFKLGSTVPVKFQLTGASAGVQNADARLYVTKAGAAVTGTELEATSTAAATAGNLFRYDPTTGQYVFNWGTKGLTAGHYQLSVVLGDGASRTAYVSLK